MENNQLFDSSDITFDKIFEEVPVDINATTTSVAPVPELPAPVVQTSEETPFVKTNDIGLAAAYLKEKGLLEIEDANNLTLEDFVLKLEAQRNKESEVIKQMILEDAGEYRNYFNLKLNGVDDEIIESIADATIVSKLKIDLTPEEAVNAEIVETVDRNRERLIGEELKFKGISETEIPIIIEGLKNKGMIPERALASKQFFEKEEEARANYYIQEKANLERQAIEERQALIKEVDNLISSKKIAGYDLNDDESKGLKKFLTSRDAVITYQDESGRNVSVKDTEYNKKLFEFQNSLEAQLSFALWLMKGASFEPIKNQGRAEQHNALWQEIQRRTSSIPDKDVFEDKYDIMELINNKNQ